MKAQVIHLQEGQGIQIPRQMLDEAGLSGEIELWAESGAILITAARQPRAGWNEAFAAMTAHGDDRFFDSEDTGSGWDHSEWEW
jgi:antitoxin MazE